MTSIMLALLSGFLTTQQAQTMSVLCTATTSPKGVTFDCMLFHRNEKGELQPVQSASTGALELDTVPLPMMGGAWCAATQAVLEFKKAPPV